MTHRARFVLLLLTGFVCVPAYAASDPWGDSPFTLQLGGFRDIKPFALKLYVFWKNPLNYVGLAVTTVLEFGMRMLFRMYGKKVSVLSKKVAAVATRG